MAAKRVAGRELNHDNWNEEEELEDAGEFKKASEDILGKRVRKVAKRRTGGIGDGVDGSGQVLNPFSGFGGFGAGANAIASTPLSSTASASPFSFLAKIPSTATSTISPKTNGETNTNASSKYAEYNGKVRALNNAFTSWIKTHVDENALCDLRPVFVDYEKYMKEFSELKKKLENASASSIPTSVFGEKKEESKNVTLPSSSTASTFSFGKPSAAPAAASNIFSSVNTSSIFSSSVPSLAAASKDLSPLKPATTESKGFSFGLAAATATSQPAAPAFSFGLSKNTTLTGAAPIFGNLASTAATPFSFSNVTQTKSSTENEQQEAAEGDEEPPKNEFVPVVEEDSLFSKRCKVFVKTSTEYADRGVGMLFLKRVENKVQLVVRADTNLGNILLNIILQEGLPTSRQGKNNVLLVCVPTPESKPPPTPVLIRVKTGEEADELLSILEKYKKEEN